MILLLMTIVQIIAESLPISSSGHLLLFSQMLNKWGFTIPDYHMLDELTALPTLFIILFWYAFDLYDALFTYSVQQMICFWWYIGIATIPTVVMYVLIHLMKLKMDFLLPLGFLATALLLFSTRYAMPHHVSFSLTPFFLIGCAQAVALVCPGLSRMAITYTVACWLGIVSYHALALSLAFEVPLLVGALLKMMLVHSVDSALVLNVPWLTSVLIGSSIGMVGLRCAMILAQHNHLWYISYYLMIPLVLSIMLI